jgi:large conductance mechanosensitive channel
MAAVMKDFKAFLLRGNVVDLAVAVVIGSAFGALVTALVRDILTPIIALAFGKHNFSRLSFQINGSHFLYGDFINYLIAFVSIAAVVFFFVVQPLNMLRARRRTQPDSDSERRQCSECLSDIPLQARKCAYCASVQSSPAPAPAS